MESGQGLCPPQLPLRPSRYSCEHSGVLAWVGDSAALHVDMHANLDQARQQCTSKARRLLPGRIMGSSTAPAPNFVLLRSMLDLGLDLGLEGLTLPLALPPVSTLTLTKPSPSTGDHLRHTAAQPGSTNCHSNLGPTNLQPG